MPASCRIFARPAREPWPVAHPCRLLPALHSAYPPRVPEAAEQAFARSERFIIRARLGTGGMGVVYDAFDRVRGHRVALKTLVQLDPAKLLALKHEFRALADLRHPNLIALYDLVEEGGAWGFSMEHVEGVDLLRWVCGLEDAPEPAVQPTGSATLEAPTFAVPQPIVDEPTAPATIAGPRAEPQRLRHALAQLTHALGALHAVGQVHRDVKPPNVLVTAKGRVVLLDFGLVTESHARATQSGVVVGTAAYMAPEQAAERPVGPAADFYAVGVMLFEALTGQRPFSGPPIALMTRKLQEDAPRASALVPDVPSDLDALCAALLAREPGQRPTGPEILRALGEDAPAERSLGAGLPLVGRARELATLEEAFARVEQGGGAVVLVEGESGVGKSALCRCFTDTLAARGTLVLRGRCYERESVPFRAFDDVVDALSRHLMAGDDEVPLPPHAGLLASAFPVLRGVPRIAAAEAAGAEPLDPQETRARLFQALRALLGTLARMRPLVLVVDDLQWADADSTVLLRELVRPPGAPSMLLVATLRTGAGREVAQALGTAAPQRLELQPLGAEDAEALAGVLLDRFGVRDLAAGVLAREGRGHPLFLEALARRAAQTTPAPRGAAGLDLEGALWAEVERLEELPRRLVALAAVAGTPLPPRVLLRASGLDPGALDRELSVLRVRRLLRTSGDGGWDRVETYHDRVREAVFARLEPAERTRLHRALALALEATGSEDAEALTTHWRLADEPARAARYAARAAERAASALAFDRAARLFALAVQLSAPAPRPLRVRWGEVLASAGLGAESARVFLDAATGAPAAEALDLQRRAAEQLLVSGHIDEGLDVMARVLDGVAMYLPKTPRAALASLLLRRVRLALRGRRFHERDATRIAADQLTRVDLCWSFSIGLGMCDTVRGADFQTRHVLLALDAGEPYRVARALATEVAFLAAAGTAVAAQVDRRIAEAHALADRVAHPHALGLVEMAHGMALFLRGEWAAAVERLGRAEAIYRERCTSVSWELASVQIFAFSSLWYLGRLGELGRRRSLRLAEAQDRGDLYAAANFSTGVLDFAALAADDPARVRADAEWAMARWSQRGFHLQHFLDLLSQGQVDLYTGDAAAAKARLDERWPGLARSLLLRVQHLRIEAVQLRARIELACAAARPGRPARPHLARARADARSLAREGPEGAAGMAALLEAGLCAQAGDDAAAATALARAIERFRASHMRLYEYSAARAAALLGRDRPALHAAEAALSAEGVASPARLARMLAPGFPEDT